MNDNSINKYIFDLYLQKDIDKLSWSDIADKVNEKYNLDLSSESCRKRVSRFQELEPTNLDDKLESKKEKYKLADVHNQINALIRRISREETIKEIAKEYAASLNEIYKLPVYTGEKIHYNKKKQATLLISDWHYGIDIDNIFNKYNPDICKQRVAFLRDRVLNIMKQEGINSLNIINLGDMIAGRIHQPIRLNSRIDVVTQAMDVTEIIAQFITHLSLPGYKIDYYSTTDNHSRIEPNIKDSLELESLSRIIDWYLKERLSHNKLVKFHDNFYGDDIVTFNVLSYRIAAVHGNKDKLDKVIDNISTFTQRHYDMICSAHYHHFSCEEKNETVLVSNSSLMGTDDFAYNLRLNSKPSQVLVISTEDNVCHHIYKINVDKVSDKK